MGEEVMSKNGAILLSGIGGVTGCFDWVEINSGWKIGRQVMWLLILTVSCDRASVGVGSPECAYRCLARLVRCIIINDDS
jgi:hypothetical protein